MLCFRVMLISCPGAWVPPVRGEMGGAQQPAVMRGVHNYTTDGPVSSPVLSVDKQIRCTLSTL